MTSIPWDELMDAAGDSDLAPIPQGDYDMKIVAAEATKSSTDKPMWKVTMEVENGPHAGKKAWTQQTLTQDNSNALQIFFRQMAAAGLTQEFFKTKPNPTQIAEALKGRRVRAKLIIEEYQGVPRNKVKAWNPPSMSAGGPPPPVGGAPSSVPPPSAPPAATTPPPAAAAPASPPPAAAPPTPPPGAEATPPPSAPPAPPAAPAPTPEAQPAGVAGGGEQSGGTEPPPF